MNDKDWERTFPFIPWREPISITVVAGIHRWVCRFCIQRHGLKAVALAECPFAFEDAASCADHIELEHPL